MQEIWKDIKGYEGLYQVSNKGNVKSFLKSSKYPYSSGHLLKPYLHKCQYLIVSLRKNTTNKNYMVHRLVAEAFIPNPNNLECVNHKDENKLNNDVTNLEWCTKAYNFNYGTARLRQGLIQGKPVNQFTPEGFLIASYCSAEYAARINGIDPSSIHKCCKNRRYSAGGYNWQYKEY